MAGTRISSKCRVLVINASSTCALELDRLFKRNGMKTLHAAGSADILDAAEEWEPHVALLCYSRAWIKKNKGWKTLKDLRRRTSLPVLLALNCPDKKVLDEGRDHLYDDFLFRPFDDSELVSRVRSRIKHAEATKEALDDRDRIESILDITRAVFSTLNITDIFETIVSKIAVALDATDCSIVHIVEEDEEAYVLESFERLSPKNLKINLNLYPELQMVLETRYPLSIDNISNHPLMKDVRDSVKEFSNLNALIIPIVFDDPLVGTMFIRVKRMGRSFNQRDMRIAGLVANASFFAIKNSRLYEIEKREKDRLKNIAITDPLTGLYNHNHFYQRLDEELSRSIRYKIPLSLIMMDIDDFKKVNDTHGHRFGDVILKSLSKTLKSCVRKADIVARYGGEEFAVILPFTPLKGGMYEAERIRAVIEKKRFGPDGDERITMSLGVSVVDGEKLKDSGELVNLADKALYMAKKAGKNCVRKA